jgi:endonuclease/exonuclease/phosphatase (EEP) superfamily protein YafD
MITIKSSLDTRTRARLDRDQVAARSPLREIAAGSTRNDTRRVTGRPVRCRPMVRLSLLLCLAACAGAATTDHPDAADRGDAAAPALDAPAMPGDAAPGDAAPVDAGPPVTLRVLSLNSWNKGSAVVAADILAASADVVGLQEVTPGETAAIVAALGDGWQLVQEDRANTVAIVSRYPILQRIGVTADPRGGVGATIAVGERLRAHVFSTHGMYTPYGPYQLVDGMAVADVLASEEAVRMPALRELLALAAPQLGSDDPTFLVGDFNAPSHLDYQPAMPWPTSRAPIEAGLVDSYAELHPDNPKKWAGEFAIDDPGITWAQSAASEPHGCYDRIDFVYYAPKGTTAIASEVLDVASSDHRAVLSTFELREPARADAATRPLASRGLRHALLSWTAGRAAVVERVYLGTGGDLALLAETSASHVLSARLAAATTYRWRVDTVTAAGVVTGDTWTFVTPPGGGLEPERRVYAPGQAIRVDFDAAQGRLDWIGLHARSAAYGAGHPSLSWKYLGDATTAPAQVIAAGTVTLTAPTTPGRYVVRFFADDGYRVLDEVELRVE